MFLITTNVGSRHGFIFTCSYIISKYHQMLANPTLFCINLTSKGADHGCSRFKSVSLEDKITLISGYCE